MLTLYQANRPHTAHVQTDDVLSSAPEGTVMAAIVCVGCVVFAKLTRHGAATVRVQAGLEQPVLGDDHYR